MSTTNLTLQTLATDMVIIQKLTHFMKVVCSAFPIRNLKSEIPNITGSIRTDVGGNSALEGAFTYGTYDGGYGPNANAYWWCGVINFAASSSSDRYSSSATEVNPLYESTLICIRY